MQRKLINTIHDDTGVHGWRLKGFLFDMPAADGRGVAHDLIEHPVTHLYPNASLYAELEALGALYMFRTITSLQVNKHRALDVSDIHSDIVFNFHELYDIPKKLQSLNIRADKELLDICQEGLIKAIRAEYKYEDEYLKYLNYPGNCSKIIEVCSKLMTLGWRKFQRRFDSVWTAYDLFHNIMRSLKHYTPEHGQDLILHYTLKDGSAYVEEYFEY